MGVQNWRAYSTDLVLPTKSSSCLAGPLTFTRNTYMTQTVHLIEEVLWKNIIAVKAEDDLI